MKCPAYADQISGFTALPGINNKMSQGLLDGIYWVPQMVCIFFGAITSYKGIVFDLQDMFTKALKSPLTCFTNRIFGFKNEC